MQETYRIDEADAGARLDVFLAKRHPEHSRSRIQKWIKAGAALLNGKPAKPHAALEAGDTVVLDAETAPETEGKGLLPRPDVAFAVVHEDDDVIVIDKPAGLLVHPAVGETDTLANGLLARRPEIANVGDDPQRPGIVHRLDRDASGLMVVARSPRAFESLKRQFQEHTVLKEYAVLVEGAPPKDADTIMLAIGRKSGSGRMAARPVAGEDDRDAVTHYRLEERLAKTSLLTVRTETGRTHQIRAHMHAIGCPVVGDPLYGVKRPGRTPSPRLFLHAWRLEFDHPGTGKRMRHDSPLPGELETVLALARKARG